MGVDIRRLFAVEWNSEEISKGFTNKGKSTAVRRCFSFDEMFGMRTHFMGYSSGIPQPLSGQQQRKTRHIGSHEFSWLLFYARKEIFRDPLNRRQMAVTHRSGKKKPQKKPAAVVE